MKIGEEGKKRFTVSEEDPILPQAHQQVCLQETEDVIIIDCFEDGGKLVVNKASLEMVQVVDGHEVVRVNSQSLLVVEPTIKVPTETEAELY